jgi:pimeloyl-ACP methyl ester carboxylesterase
MSPSINTDYTIQVSDGRIVGAASAGKIDGPPVFHFHGNGSSRIEVRLIAETAARVGVRLIGLDRPGIGRSDAKPGFQILDWPDIVADVADQLGIESFAVEGISGGGAYAMACAYKIPYRLSACGIISTVPPSALMSQAGPGYLRVMWWMGIHVPWLFRACACLLSRAMGSDEVSIEKYIVRVRALLGPADQKLVDKPEIRRALVKALAESRRQGREANLHEKMTLVRPWGFEIEKIKFHRIFLWHGEEDRIMPAAPVHQLAQALPHCTATFYPEEGHFSTMANHSDEILGALKPVRS